LLADNARRRINKIIRTEEKSKEIRRSVAIGADFHSPFVSSYAEYNAVSCSLLCAPFGRSRMFASRMKRQAKGHNLLEHYKRFKKLPEGMDKSVFFLLYPEEGHCLTTYQGKDVLRMADKVLPKVELKRNRHRVNG
jgi:hypothetical protein